MIKENIEFISDYKIDSGEYWDVFYKHFDVAIESSFCNYIKSKIDKETVVVDLGCGTGRDTRSFYESGFKVVGIDRSLEAIATNQKLSNTREEHINFKQIDITEETVFFRFLQEVSNTAHVSGKRLLIYSRFFLHSIDATAENILLKAISRFLKTGDIFAAEFRTIEDSERNKIYGDHFRRYINSDLFVKKLETQYYFQCLEYTKGTGYSILKEEDPFLARVFAQKL